MVRRTAAASEQTGLLETPSSCLDSISVFDVDCKGGVVAPVRAIVHDDEACCGTDGLVRIVKDSR